MAISLLFNAHRAAVAIPGIAQGVVEEAAGGVHPHRVVGRVDVRHVGGRQVHRRRVVEEHLKLRKHAFLADKTKFVYRCVLHLADCARTAQYVIYCGIYFIRIPCFAHGTDILI